jgi:chemotaxis signal transduction protein
MTDSPSGLVERVAELRSAFDRAFAVPPRADAGIKQDLLAIRVGPEPCAIRLSEVGGLFVDRRITRIPTTEAALIGIAGFRGAIVPVYSLRAVLGHSGTEPTRWLVIATAAPVALAFDLFEGHMRVPADAVLPQQPNAQMRSLAPDFVRGADAVRPVLHLPSIIAALSTSEPPATAAS